MCLQEFKVLLVQKCPKWECHLLVTRHCKIWKIKFVSENILDDTLEKTSTI